MPNVDPRYAANLSAYTASQPCHVCAALGHAARDCRKFPCLYCNRVGHPLYRCFRLPCGLGDGPLQDAVVQHRGPAPPLPGYSYMHVVWHLLPLPVTRALLTGEKSREPLRLLGITAPPPPQGAYTESAHSVITYAPPSTTPAASAPSAISATWPTLPSTSASLAQAPPVNRQLPATALPPFHLFRPTPAPLAFGTAPSAGQAASLESMERLRLPLGAGGGEAEAPRAQPALPAPPRFEDALPGRRGGYPMPSLPAAAPSAPLEKDLYTSFQPRRKGGWVWDDLLHFLEALVAVAGQAPSDPFPRGSFKTGPAKDFFKLICAAAHSSPATGAYAAHIHALILIFFDGGPYTRRLYEISLPRGQSPDPLIYANSLNTSYFASNPPLESAGINGSSMWFILSRLLSSCISHLPQDNCYAGALKRALEARVRPPPPPLATPPQQLTTSAAEAGVGGGARGGGLPQEGGGRHSLSVAPTSPARRVTQALPFPPTRLTPQQPTRGRTGDSTVPESPSPHLPSQGHSGRLGAPTRSHTHDELPLLLPPTPHQPPRGRTGDTTVPESPPTNLPSQRRPRKRGAPQTPSGPSHSPLLQGRPPQPPALPAPPLSFPHSPTQPQRPPLQGLEQGLTTSPLLLGNSQDDFASFPFAQ